MEGAEIDVSGVFKEGRLSTGEEGVEAAGVRTGEDESRDEISEEVCLRGAGLNWRPHLLHWGSPGWLTNPHFGHFTARLVSSGQRLLAPTAS
jgi:hypothetical protein